MDRRRTSMTTYFGGGESYRPEYNTRRGSSPRRESPPRPRTEDREGGIPTGPKKDRPSGPARTVSYVGSRQYYPSNIPQTDGSTRSAHTTPVDSPGSPLAGNSDKDATKPNRSIDPRPWKKSSRLTDNTGIDVISTNSAVKLDVNTGPSQPLKVGQIDNATALGQPSKPELEENAVNKWLKENVRRAVLEDRLDRINEVLDEKRAEEEDQKSRWPDHRLIHEQISAERKKIEVKANNLSARIQESIASESKIVKNMTDEQRSFLAGVLPVTGQGSTPDPRMQEIESRLQLQELELQRLKRLTNDAGVDEQSSALSKLVACEQKVNSQCLRLDETSQSLQGYKDTLNSHKQLITDLELRLKSSEALKSNQEEVVAEFKAKVLSYGSQIANLSSNFTTQKDHNELSSIVQRTASSNSKIERALEAALADLNTLKTTDTALASQLDELKTSTASIKDDLLQTMKLSAQSQSQLAPIQLRSNDIEQIKEEVQCKLAELDATLDKIRPTLTDGSSLSALQTKVEKLSSFQGHYEKFYKDTESRLKVNEEVADRHDGALLRLRDQYSIIESRQNEAQKAASTSFASNDLAMANLQGEVRALQTSNSASSANLPQEVTHKLSNIEKQYNDFSRSVEATARQNIAMSSAAAKAQFDALRQEIDSFKPLIYRNDNSIKALDSRWNAISTAHLHRGIINSLVPLGPLCDQLKDEHARLLKQISDIQNGNTQLQRDLDALKVETSHQVPATDTAIQVAVANLKVRVDGIAEDQRESSLHREEIDQLQRQMKELSEKANGDPSNQEDMDVMAMVVRLNKIQEQILAMQSHPPECVRTLANNTKELEARASKNEQHISDQKEGLIRCEAQGTTISDELSQVQSVVANLQKQMDNVASLHDTVVALQDDIHALEPRNPTNVSERFQALQDMVNDLHQTVEELKGLKRVATEPATDNAFVTNLNTTLSRFQDCLSSLLHRQDSFVKVTNLASKVDEDHLRKQLDPIQITNVWFRGGKDPVSKKTTRYALIQLQTPDPRRVIQKVNSLKQIGQNWKGREPTASEADVETVKAVLLNPLEGMKTLRAFAPPSVYPSNDTGSVAPSNEDVEDAITVDDIAHQDSAPPTSDAYLKMWKATKMPSPAKSIHAPESRTSTPLNATANFGRGAKRGAQELSRSNSSSQAGPKRGRFDS